MPNMLLVMVQPDISDPHWPTHLDWRVPVNDEHTFSFIASRLNPKTGKTGTRGRPKAPPGPDTLAMVDAILGGEARIQDVDPDTPNAFIIQDNVAIAGLGRIADRTNERLGRADAPVNLLRKLWRREFDCSTAAGDSRRGGSPPNP